MAQKLVLDKDYFLYGALQHNYLPGQLRDREELPPILASKTFSLEAAEQLYNARQRTNRSTPGYDAVQYRLTRFNGLARTCSIPHPKAYATLVIELAENLHQWKHITENNNSLIRPAAHSDGRLVIMNYPDKYRRVHISECFDCGDNLSTASFGDAQSTRKNIDSLGKRVIAETDITNFYPSIYSHAVPWALVGVSEAKKNRSKNSKWYNKIDKAIRMNKRDETHGIAIGPATSNVIAEIILSKIDEALRNDFVYTRFNDDYMAYTGDEAEARRFISALSDELAKYELQLNASKTGVHTLPKPSNPKWIVDLNIALPTNGIASPRSVALYLDLALALAQQHPDASVLKYGIKSLASTETDKASNHTVLPYLFNLGFHYPSLMPLLDIWLGKLGSSEERGHYEMSLNKLLNEHAKEGNADAVVWEIYYFMKYGYNLDDDCVDAILDSNDVMSILMLYFKGDKDVVNRIVKFCHEIASGDYYQMDQYWILLYQVFFDGLIGNPYTSDDTFEILRDSGVTFYEPLKATP